MASGHVSRTNRPNTWLHRPAMRRKDFSCQPGAVHTWHLPLIAMRQVIEFASAYRPIRPRNGSHAAVTRCAMFRPAFSVVVGSRERRPWCRCNRPEEPDAAPRPPTDPPPIPASAAKGRTSMRALLRLLLAVMALAALAPAVLSQQAFPTHPIRLIVP